MTELRQRMPRVKDAKRLAWIREQACCVCRNTTTVDAAHIRTSNILIGKDDHGWGRPDDKWCLPLCRACHTEQHTMNEMAWWESKGLDPFILAMTTYRGPRS